MGKSISITAMMIAISTNHVGGYTIIPGKPIDDDYPLPPSLEQIRSKLVYRTTPLLTPPEIQQINSRQLQSYNSSATNTQNDDNIKTAIKNFDNAWKAKYETFETQTTSDYINHLIIKHELDDLDESPFREFYMELLEGKIERAGRLFQNNQLSYNNFFTELVQDLYEFFMDKDDKAHQDQAVALFGELQEIIFVMRGREERYNEVTATRQLIAIVDDERFLYDEDESFLYTLSFLTRSIMTSVKTDGAKYYVYRYMWSYLRKSEHEHGRMLDDRREIDDYSEYFGFVLYDEKFIEKGMSEWEIKNDQDTFEQFIGVLVDIDNWDNKNHEVHFKVPILSDIAFKAQYLVQVLHDGNYGLNNGDKYFNLKEIGRNEAKCLMAIQRVLIEWYNQGDILKDWEFGRLTIGNSLSRDLMKKDSAKILKDSWHQQQAMGTAPNKAVLDWIYASK